MLRASNIGFFIAMIVSIGLFALRTACDEDARFKIRSETYILHADQTVVAVDTSGKAVVYSGLQRVNVGCWQFGCTLYIAAWTLARLKRATESRHFTTRVT